MTISNELQSSAFVSNPEISIVLVSSPFIQLKPVSSPHIEFVVHRAGSTLTRVKPNALTVLALPKDSTIAGWKLKSVILVRIRYTRKQCVAITWLEGIAEYGAGERESEAITDLVDSLGEYRQSLERREAHLGDLARKELDYLRKLVEPR